jgi:hypothetical protein
MKTTAIFTAVFALMTLAAFGVEVSQALRERIENPPSISTNYTHSYTFKTPSALIEGKDFVAFLALTKQADSDKVTYRFRSYSKRHKLEVTGQGEVFERYYRIADPSAKQHDDEVFDRGSQLLIDAGLFKIEWSSGNHIYYQDGFTVVEAKESEYEAKIKR